jgi:hypothetical protein
LLLAENTKLYDPNRVAERDRGLLPDVTIDLTPDAGHGVVFQHPERITRLILDFIDDQEPETLRREPTRPGTRVTPPRPDSGPAEHAE